MRKTAHGFTLMNRNFKRKSKGFTLMKQVSVRELGFTLIELLVVISIIGLLATLITANLNAARSRSRDAVRKADLKNIQTALRIYYNDNGAYPGSLSWGEEWSSGSNIYMNEIPADPLPDQSYAYTADSENDTFTITACLENTSDTKCDTDEGGNIVSCSGNVGCLYTVEP